MASTTKVMTALMAIEYGHLDEVVTVGRNAYGVPGTSIYLDLGEQIPLRDLLYGLMLASGTMKLAQMLTDSPEPYTLFRVYFVLAFVFLMAGGVYPVLHIKRFVGEPRNR